MLTKALTALYAAFAGYPAPATMDTSPLHDPNEILGQLASAPLAELTASALSPDASRAMSIVGDMADYKHFLPRIIHLAITTMVGRPVWRPA